MEPFQALVADLIASVLASVKAGASLTEFGRLFAEFLRLASAAAVKLALSGPGKKAEILKAAMSLYDQAVPLLPLPFWLRWLPGLLRAPVEALISGLLEWVYTEVVKPEA